MQSFAIFAGLSLLTFLRFSVPRSPLLSLLLDRAYDCARSRHQGNIQQTLFSTIGTDVPFVGSVFSPSSRATL